MNNNNNSNSAQMVLLAEFNTDFEANVVKSMLEDAGIECALTGEYAKYSFLNDPVKLLVHSADLQRAQEIMAATPVSENELWQMASDPEAKMPDGISTKSILLLALAVIVACATIYYIFSWGLHF